VVAKKVEEVSFIACITNHVSITARMELKEEQRVLVTWKDYPVHATLHICYSSRTKVNQTCFIVICFMVNYDSPQIEDWVIRHKVHKFICKVDSCLDKSVSRGLFFSVEVYHDVYRKLFGEKLELYQSDFCSRYFTCDWDCNYKNSSGTYRGQKIRYPLVVKQDIGNRYTKNNL